MSFFAEHPILAAIIVAIVAGAAGAAMEALCTWSGRIPSFLVTTLRLATALFVFWLFASYGLQLGPLRGMLMLPAS